MLWVEKLLTGGYECYEWAWVKQKRTEFSETFTKAGEDEAFFPSMDGGKVSGVTYDTLTSEQDLKEAFKRTVSCHGVLW